jgi:ferrous iron transport protein A
MDMFAAGLRTFPLPLASEGERVRIVGFQSGREMERKLADLGLCVGSEITVLSRNPNGPLLVARDSVRVGIGVGIAHRVIVVRIANR